MTQAATVSRPEDLLTLLPYLLGYHPLHSLVLMGLIDRRRLGPVERLDSLRPGQSYPEGLLAGLSRPLRDDGAGAVLLAAFDDCPETRGRALRQVGAAMGAAGLDVVDRLVVVDGAWWSMDCQNPDCCPAGGRPLPTPADVPAVAAFVWRGVAPLPDRAAVAAHLTPEPASPRGAALRPLPRLTPAQACAAWAVVLGAGRDEGSCAGASFDSAGDQQGVAGANRHGDHADDPDGYPVDRGPGRSPQRRPDLLIVQQAITAAADPRLRDHILQLLCPGLLPSQLDNTPPTRARVLSPGLPPLDDVEAILERMVRLGRSLPDVFRRDVVSMTAAVAWWHGRGTLARLCADQALAIDSRHSLAKIVVALLDAGVRPGGCC